MSAATVRCAAVRLARCPTRQASIPTGEAKADLDRAFEQLYRDHLRDVYSYSYYRVGNHHDAEDLTEQAFLQAYRHFERARRESDGRPLRPWLIRIAHNLASNYHRDRARRPAAGARGERADRGAARDRAHRRGPGGAEDASWTTSSTCPDDRRDALIMRFALGMDNREIARALGRTDGATKVLIHRAIRQLEEEMHGRKAQNRRPRTMNDPSGQPRPDVESCCAPRCARSSRPRACPAGSRTPSAPSPRPRPRSCRRGPTSSPSPSSPRCATRATGSGPVAAIAPAASPAARCC